MWTLTILSPSEASIKRKESKEKIENNKNKRKINKNKWKMKERKQYLHEPPYSSITSWLLVPGTCVPLGNVQSELHPPHSPPRSDTRGPVSFAPTESAKSRRVPTAETAMVTLGKLSEYWYGRDYEKKKKKRKKEVSFLDSGTSDGYVWEIERVLVRES